MREFLFTRSRLALFAALFVAAIGVGPCSSCNAGVFGSAGNLGFDFIDGDGVLGNNTVKVFNLKVDGISYSSPFSLNDSLTRSLVSLTYGQTVEFDFQLTNNVAGFPDTFAFYLLDISAPEPLSLVNTDDAGGFALFSVTLDPNSPTVSSADNFNNLTASGGGVDISWSAPTYDLQSNTFHFSVFTGDPPNVQVPEPASLLIWSLGGLGFALTRRKMSRTA